MARKSDYLDHLARVPLFSRCSRDELKRLAQRTTDIRAEPGQVLVRERQGAYEFFVIVDGQAEVTRHGRTVAKLERGDFFGEIALLDRSRRDATVTALSPMELIVLTDFEAALDDAPHLARRLLAGMARRLRALDEAS